MSTAAPRKKTPETPAEAQALVEKKKKQIADDQEWVNEQSKNLNEEERKVLFERVLKQCKAASVVDDRIVVQCPLNRQKLSKGTYCAYPDEQTKIEPPAGKELHDVQNFDGVDLDVALITSVEANYGGGYVPWGPGIRYSKDKKTGQEKILPTSRGISGVTYGRGVDLGQLNTPEQKQDFEASLDTELEEAGMPEAQREQQITRLSQFYGKKAADACAAFADARAKGTHAIDPRTVSAMNHRALEGRAGELLKSFKQVRNKRLADHATEVKAAKKKNLPPPPAPNLRTFDQLSTSEKTVLMSAYYQEGSLRKHAHTRELVKATMEGDTEGAAKALMKKTEHANKDFAHRAKTELKYFRGENPPPPTCVPSAPRTHGSVPLTLPA